MRLMKDESRDEIFSVRKHSHRKKIRKGRVRRWVNLWDNSIIASEEVFDHRSHAVEMALYKCKNRENVTVALDRCKSP